MVSAFSRWKRYDETRQNLAKVRKLRKAIPLSINMDDQVHVLPKFVCLPMNLTIPNLAIAYKQAQLEMIVACNGLSENVYEIASKSLAA